MVPAYPHSPPMRGHYLRPDASRRGFSLIELLIVMALLVIMTTLYFSSGSKGFQARKRLECERNLRNIYVALKTYSLDGKGFPVNSKAVTSEQALSVLIPKYTTSTEYFLCPGISETKLPDAQPFADRRISYAYYMGHKIDDGGAEPLLTDRQVNSKPKAVGDPLFSVDGKKPGNNHNKYGGNVMFCDGNVLASGTASAFALTNAPGITLLNPKP